MRAFVRPPSAWATRRNPGLIGSFDDLHVHLGHDGFHRVLKYGALISTVGVEFQEKWTETEQSRHHQRTAIAILNISGMHDA
jgi:hypothetical protein